MRHDRFHTWKPLVVFTRSDSSDHPLPRGEGNGEGDSRGHKEHIRAPCQWQSLGTRRDQSSSGRDSSYSSRARAAQSALFLRTPSSTSSSGNRSRYAGLPRFARASLWRSWRTRPYHSSTSSRIRSMVERLGAVFVLMLPLPLQAAAQVLDGLFVLRDLVEPSCYQILVGMFLAPLLTNFLLV
jgi:hypothetical protein